MFFKCTNNVLKQKRVHKIELEVSDFKTDDIKIIIRVRLIKSTNISDVYNQQLSLELSMMMYCICSQQHKPQIIGIKKKLINLD